MLPMGNVRLNKSAKYNHHHHCTLKGVPQKKTNRAKRNGLKKVCIHASSSYKGPNKKWPTRALPSDHQRTTHSPRAAPSVTQVPRGGLGARNTSGRTHWGPGGLSASPRATPHSGPSGWYGAPASSVQLTRGGPSSVTTTASLVLAARPSPRKSPEVP
jgi:hypothetical protein